MSTKSGISKLINKKLLIVSDTPVFDTATNPSGLSANVEGLEWYNPGNSAAPAAITGKALINLKPGQIVEVSGEIPIYRERQSSSGDSGSNFEGDTKNSESIDILMLVVKVIGEQPGTEIGGTILGVNSYGTIAYGFAGSNSYNELGTRYIEFKGLPPEQESDPAPSGETEQDVKSNFIFIGDLQFDTKHSALRSTLVDIYSSTKEEEAMDIVYLPRNVSKKSMLDKGGYYGKKKIDNMIKNIKSFKDPTDYVFICFGSTDILRMYANNGDHKNNYNTFLSRYKELLDKMVALFSGRTAEAKIIVIGVPPFMAVSPEDTEGKAGSYHKHHNDASGHSPNSLINKLNTQIKVHVTSLASRYSRTGHFWFINPKEVLGANLSTGFAHKSNVKAMKYNGLSSEVAIAFANRANARGMLNTSPVQYQDSKKVEYLDWTQRCDSGNESPFYIGTEKAKETTTDYLTESEKCTWYVPVRTVYNSTTDFRRFLPPTEAGTAVGSYVKVLGNTVNHSIEDKIEEYRAFAVRKLISHLIGGKKNLDKYLERPDLAKRLDDINNSNVFLSKPFIYTSRDANDNEITVDNPTPGMLETFTKKSQDVYVESRNGGKLWILYRVPEKIFNASVAPAIDKATLNELKINNLQSVKGVNYDSRIFLPFKVPTMNIGLDIKEAFQGLEEVLNSPSCGYIIAHDQAPSPQFSYAEDGLKLESFFLAISELLTENGLGQAKGAIEIGYKEIEGTAGLKKELSYAYAHILPDLIANKLKSLVVTTTEYSPNKEASHIINAAMRKKSGTTSGLKIGDKRFKYEINESVNLMKGLERFKNHEVNRSARLRGYLEVDSEINGSSVPQMITDLNNKVAAFSNPDLADAPESDANAWIKWVEQYTFPDIRDQPKVIEKDDAASSSPSDVAKAKTQKNKKPVRSKDKIFVADKAERERIKKQKELLEFNKKMDSIAFSAAITFAEEGVSPEDAKKAQIQKVKTARKELDRLNKEASALVRSPSFFTLMENVTRVFGKGGLYDVVLNKTDWKVLVKSLAECVGIQLEGDDLVEVICNAVLQNMPMDELQKIVNKGINDAVLDAQNMMQDAMDEIKKEMEKVGVDLSVWSRAAEEALRAADFGQDLNMQMFETQAGLTSQGGVFEPKPGTFAGDAYFQRNNTNSPKRLGAGDNNQCATDQERMVTASEYGKNYSSSNNPDSEAKFLFFKSNRKYEGGDLQIQAVQLWQRTLWIIQNELNFPSIIPKSFTDEKRWCDGKFGKETAAATSAFAGRTFVTYGDFAQYFDIDMGLSNDRLLQAIRSKNDELRIATAGTRSSKIAGLQGVTKIPAKSDLQAGDYLITVKRVGEDNLTLATDYLIAIKRYIISGGKLTFDVVSTELVTSHKDARTSAQSYYKSLKEESPTAQIVVDTSAIATFTPIESIQNAAQGRDWLANAVQYLDPDKQLEVLFQLAEDAGVEINNVLNKVLDRRQLCALLSDAIDEILKFMQGDYSSLEKIGRFFNEGAGKFEDQFRAFAKNAEAALEDMFSQVGTAFKNALISSLEAVIIGVIKVVLGYLLIACKFVQKGIEHARNVIAEPLRKTAAWQATYDQATFDEIYGIARNEKGLITEEGLLNIASDIQISEEGITLIPDISDNSVVSFVDSILKDYGQSLDDLDNVVDNVIPATMEVLSSLEGKMKPHELATMLTPNVPMEPGVRKIIRDTLNESDKSQQLNDFFNEEMGFIDFTRYVGTFVKIPTIKEIDNIASLDPCALVEDPFMLEDMRAQQEALKDSNKKNLEEFLGLLLNNGQIPTDVNLNIPTPSAYYGIRNTLLDGVFDTFDLSFNLEMTAVPTIYCVPKGQADAKAELKSLQENLGFNQSDDEELFMPTVFTDDKNPQNNYFETLSRYAEHFSSRTKTVALFREISEDLRDDSNYAYLQGSAGQTALQFQTLREDQEVTIKYETIDPTNSQLGTVPAFNSLYEQMRDSSDSLLQSESDQQAYSVEQFQQDAHRSYELSKLRIDSAGGGANIISSVEQIDGGTAAALAVDDERDTFNNEGVFPLNLSSEGLPIGEDKRPWAFSVMLKNSVERASSYSSDQYDHYYNSFFSKETEIPLKERPSYKIAKELRDFHYKPMLLSYFRKIGNIISESPLLKNIPEQRNIDLNYIRKLLGEDSEQYKTIERLATKPVDNSLADTPLVMQKMIFSTALVSTLLHGCDIDFPSFLNVDSIKDIVGQRHSQYLDSTDLSTLDSRDNDLLELATMEGLMRLMMRVFILDYVIRTVFVYTEFRVEDILANDNFVELILNNIDTKYDGTFPASVQYQLADAIRVQRLETGEVLPTQIVDGKTMRKNMVYEELIEISTYIANLIPAQAYKLYNQVGADAAGPAEYCTAGLKDRFFDHVPDPKDIPSELDADYIDQFFICPQIMSPPIFTRLDLAELTARQAAVRDLPQSAGVELKYETFDFDSVLGSEVVNPRFSGKPILEYFTKENSVGELGKGLADKDQHGGFYLEKYIKVMDKINPETRESLFDEAIRGIGGDYENFVRSIDTIGICDISVFYGFLNGLRKDSIGAEELDSTDPDVLETLELSAPPDYPEFRFKGDEETISKIEEVLNHPLNHYFEELSYGMRLMYLPKPEEIGDKDNTSIVTSSIQEQDKNEIEQIIELLEDFLKSAGGNQESDNAQNALDSIDERIEATDNDYELSLLQELRQNLQDNLDYPSGTIDQEKYEAKISVLAKFLTDDVEYFLDEEDTVKDQRIAIHIKDMIVDNVLLGARSEDELRLNIERKVLELQEFVKNSPDPNLTVEFLGETITFMGEEVIDPDRFLQSAMERIKKFFLRNKAFFIVEKFQKPVSIAGVTTFVDAKMLLTPIPVKTSEESLFDLFDETTSLLTLAGPKNPPEVFVDVVTETVYPSNQFIAELRAQTFGIDRFSIAGQEGKIDIHSALRDVGDTYKGLLGAIGDPAAGGTLYGPQREADNNYPHGAFPLTYYLDDTNFTNLINEAKGGDLANDVSLENLQVVNNEGLENETDLNQGYSSPFNIDPDEIHNSMNPANDVGGQGGIHAGFNTGKYGQVSFDEDNHTFSIPLFTLPDGTEVYQHQMFYSIDPARGTPSSYVSFFSNGASPDSNIMLPQIDDNGTPDDEADDIIFNQIADCGEINVFGGTRCRYASKYDQWGAPKLVAFINPAYTGDDGVCFAASSHGGGDGVGPTPCRFHPRHSRFYINGPLGPAIKDDNGEIIGREEMTLNYGQFFDYEDEDTIDRMDYMLSQHLHIIPANRMQEYVDNFNNSNPYYELEIVEQYCYPTSYPGEWVVGGAGGGSAYTTIYPASAGGTQTTYPFGDTGILDALIKSDLHSKYLQLEKTKVVYKIKLTRLNVDSGGQSINEAGMDAVAYEISAFDLFGPSGFADDTFEGIMSDFPNVDSEFKDAVKLYTPIETHFYAIAFDQVGGKYEGSSGFANNNSGLKMLQGVKGHAGYPLFKMLTKHNVFTNNESGDVGAADIFPSRVEGKIASFPPQVDFRALLDNTADRLTDKVKEFVGGRFLVASQNTDIGVTIEKMFDEAPVEDFTEPGQIVKYSYNPQSKLVDSGQQEMASVLGKETQYDNAVVTMEEYVAFLYSEITDSDVTKQTRDIFLDSDVQDFNEEFATGKRQEDTIQGQNKGKVGPTAFETIIKFVRYQLLNTLRYVDRDTLPIVKINKPKDVKGGESYTSDLYGVISYFYNKKEARVGISNGDAHCIAQHNIIKAAHLGWLQNGAASDRASTFMGRPTVDYDPNFKKGTLKPFEILDRNSEQFFMGNKDFTSYFDTTRRFKTTKTRYKISDNPFVDIEEIAMVAGGAEGYPSPGLSIRNMFETEFGTNENLLVRGDLEVFDLEEEADFAPLLTTLNNDEQVGSAIADLKSKTPYSSVYESRFGYINYASLKFAEKSADIDVNLMPLTISPNDYADIYTKFHKELAAPVSADRLRSAVQFFHKINFAQTSLPVISDSVVESAHMLLNSYEDLFMDGLISLTKQGIEDYIGEQIGGLFDDDSGRIANYVSVFRQAVGLEAIEGSDVGHSGTKSVEYLDTRSDDERANTFYYVVESDPLPDKKGLFFVGSQVNSGKHLLNIQNYLRMLQSPSTSTIQTFMIGFLDTPYYYKMPVKHFHVDMHNIETYGINQNDYVITNDTRLLFSTNLTADAEGFSGLSGGSKKHRKDFIRFMSDTFDYESNLESEHMNMFENIHVNGMEIKTNFTRLIEGAGNGLIFEKYDKKSLLEQIKNSDEVEALLNYSFPMNRMLYILTNYIYMKVTRRRPGLQYFLNGSKTNVKDLVTSFASSAETFLKDKETVEQYRDAMATSAGRSPQPDFTDEKEALKHFEGQTVPLIIKGLLQEIDPAWKVTKILSDAIPEGGFPANKKCGSPFEPFNRKYKNHIPLSFISTPIGLLASGIWSSVEPLPCRLNEAADKLTCDEVATGNCEEQE